MKMSGDVIVSKKGKRLYFTLTLVEGKSKKETSNKLSDDEKTLIQEIMNNIDKLANLRCRKMIQELLTQTK
jgi:DNA-binding CsgD family transcriptional regulator